MPPDGNDSGATWQGPPNARPNSVNTDIHTSTSATFNPRQPSQLQGQEGTPVVPPVPTIPTEPSIRTHTSFADDHWEPVLDDDSPLDSDEAFDSFAASQVAPVMHNAPGTSQPVNMTTVTPIHPMPTSVAPVTPDTSSASMPRSQGTGIQARPVSTAPKTTAKAAVQPTSSRRTALNGQLGYYTALIIVPFLFAILTGLITLPAVATGSAKLPSQALIPLLIILLVIALAQSVTIYYTGTENNLWVVVTLSAFFVFALVGCYTLAGPVATFLLFIVIIALYVLLFRFCVHDVTAGTLEIVQTSKTKNYHRILHRGFNLLFPWEKVVQTLPLTDKMWTTPPQTVPLSEVEDIVLRANITYQIDPNADFELFLNIKQWEKDLYTIFTAKLQDIANTFTPNFIAWLRGKRGYAPYDDGVSPFIAGESRWQHINDTLKQQMESRVASWDVLIKDVQVLDISLVAHNRYISTSADEDTDPASYMQQATIPSMTAASPPSPQQEQPKQASPSAAPAPAPSSAAQQPSLPPPNLLTESALVSAYRAVQNGSITDPEIIRDLARRFELVAKNPELYQKVNFDAMRAALSLFKEADRREAALAARAGTLFDDTTRTDLRAAEGDETSNLGA